MTKKLNRKTIEKSNSKAKVLKEKKQPKKAKAELNVQLSAPIHTYAKKINALFKNDPEIYVSSAEEIEKGCGQYNMVIKTTNFFKAAVLKLMMRDKVKFGKLTLNIIVDDDVIVHTPETIIKQLNILFEGNSIFSQAIDSIDEGLGKHKYFCLFQPKILQFFNDDLSDYYQNWNGMPHQVAKEIFKKGFKINYCVERNGDELIPDTPDPHAELCMKILE